MIKKPYTPPTVSKVEMDSDVIRMLTKQGFACLFWERLQEAKKINDAVTREEVFDVLNAKYESVIGCTRYSCYDSFRQRLNK